MLTAEQAHAAREAFEASRRRTFDDLNAKLAKVGVAAADPRLERDQNGEYVDVHRRIDWNRWRDAWEACLAHTGLHPQRAIGVN